MRVNKTITMVVIVSGLLVCMGCGSSGKMVNEKPELKKELNMPEWVAFPQGKKVAKSKENGYIYGAGSYSVLDTDRDPDFAITMADHRARRKIQEYLVYTIASTVKDFSQKAGYNGVESDEAAVVASASLGALDVSAADVVQREFKKGVLYSRVRWPLDNKKRDAILRAVRKGLYGQEALRSRFAAEKEWKKLEERLNKRLDSGNND